MKINISRQSIYLLILSILLLTFVLFFSFLVLIPAGKDYREQRTQLLKENRDLKRDQNFYDETSDELKKLQADNRHVIEAFDTIFNPQRFQKQHATHFKSLTISQKVHIGEDHNFSVYEVNTSSHINSPKSFYNFLDSLDNDDWIIGISFPIVFKREEEMIKSTFTMKVYSNIKEKKAKDLNASK